MEKEILKKVLDYLIIFGDLNFVRYQKELATKNQDFEKAAALRDQERKILESIDRMETPRELKAKLD